MRMFLGNGARQNRVCDLYDARVVEDEIINFDGMVPAGVIVCAAFTINAFNPFAVCGRRGQSPVLIR